LKNKAAEIIFQKKRERRRQLAKLPFEKKIEIVVELQKATAVIRKDPRHIVWPLLHEEGTPVGRGKREAGSPSKLTSAGLKSIE
jgi:hypothetical protein